MAARALGQLGDGRAIDPLLQLLEDADARVRESVAQALGKLTDWCGNRRRCVPTPPRRLQLSFGCRGKRVRAAALPICPATFLRIRRNVTHLPAARPRFSNTFSEEEVRRCDEDLAERFPLRLAWRDDE
ncbi:MAG: HEAT repeat domain-containing protein [Egibacteraceae bacterium]